MVTLIVPEWPEGTEEGVQDIHEFYGVLPIFRVKTVALPRWRSLELPYYALLLPLFARAMRPDFIHARGLTAAWGSAELLRVPTILELHDAPSSNARLRFLFARIVDSSHLYVLAVITRALADHVRLQICEQRSAVIVPDGVDSAWLDNALDQNTARKTVGLSGEQRPVAVYTGHLYKGRGIELILELGRRVPSYLFLIVGGRDEDVKRYRSEAVHIQNVQFAGFRAPNEMRMYQRAADVLLMPYGHEVAVSGRGGNTAAFASPMKMFEYMAAGKPILASELPVLQEVLKDNVNALLLPYDEPDRWVAALDILRREAGLARRLGERALADVHKYTWEKRAERLLEALNASACWHADRAN